ncbi:acetylornithine deacetylase [Abyssibius alkaniclasticus]|uniref:acetylornithine deacetylase n=1 Tax=Abyssibius alkaniclasticus TaxID=2881234 RepID=UPI002363DD4C|nr:acetylornithine deacetylase [Abyssibius alkaniclasticus]UPH72402.1 acetylornithine deacetylase [Abyssibius alkaniclasticus]
MFDQTIQILGKLISFPTISSDSNLALIDWVADYVAGHGAHVEISHDASGTKGNLFATFGPMIDGGIILSGHSDVVPTTGQAWSRDAFTLHESGGLYYGRGACDMKGFIACALALAPQLAQAGLSKPIHIALSYDEETGCLGAPVMLAALAARGLRPGICIVGEPTSMRLINGHKGCCEMHTVLGGLEGHSSMPAAGVNAAVYAARYIGQLMEIAEALKARAPADSPFDPPQTTLNVGRLAAGVATNVIPNHAEIDWEYRPVQPDDIAFVKTRINDFANNVLLPEMRATHPGASIETRTIAEVVGLEPEAEGAAQKLVLALTGANTTATVPFGTEAGLFAAQGISTVVCGPGDIAQAHKPDEFVSGEQLRQCLTMLERLLARVSA